MRANNQISALRSRIIRAGTWSLGGHVAGQVLRLASSLIMTRLLVPEMFGIMALANVILVGLALFSDIGLYQGVIQSRRGHDPAYLNTVWTVQILRGFLLWLVALLIGAVIHFLDTLQWLPTGSAYADPILPFVIAVLSLNALISGFTSTRLATANRNLALGYITIIELVSQLAALLCMFAWAFVDRSIWALVVGSLLGGLTKVVLSHALLPGEKNNLHWDQDAFKEIFGFGKWVFLTSVLGFLAANGDRLLLGAFTDPTTLGFYAIALFIVNAIQESFSKLNSKVAYPAFCEVVRERRRDLKSVYYKFRLPFDMAALLATGLLFSSGHFLIRLLYDDRYYAAGHMVEVLCITLFEVRFRLAGQCFMAMGMPNLMAPGMLIRLVIIFTVIPVAYPLYGVNGVLWTIALSSMSALPYTFYLKIKYGIFDLWRELVVLPFLVVGFGLGAIINFIAAL